MIGWIWRLTQVLAVSTPGSIELDEDVLVAVRDLGLECGIRHDLDLGNDPLDQGPDACLVYN